MKPKGNGSKSGLRRQQNSFGKFPLEYNQGAFADIDDDQMNEQPLSLGLDKYDLNEMDEDMEVDKEGSAFNFETEFLHHKG